MGVVVLLVIMFLGKTFNEVIIKAFRVRTAMETLMRPYNRFTISRSENVLEKPSFQLQLTLDIKTTKGQNYYFALENLRPL